MAGGGRGAGLAAGMGAVVHAGLGAVIEVPASVVALMGHQPAEPALDGLFALRRAAAVADGRRCGPRPSGGRAFASAGSGFSAARFPLRAGSPPARPDTQDAQAAITRGDGKGRAWRSVT